MFRVKGSAYFRAHVDMIAVLEIHVFLPTHDPKNADRGQVQRGGELSLQGAARHPFRTYLGGRSTTIFISHLENRRINDIVEIVQR